MIGSNLFARRRTGVAGLAVLAHEDAVGHHGRCQWMQPPPLPQILAQTREGVLSPRLADLLMDVTLLAPRDGAGDAEARGVHRGNRAHSCGVAMG